MKEFELKRSTLAAFAAPAIPVSAIGLPLTVYLFPYYSMVRGLDIAAVGLVIMFARFWDIFTDPTFGIISDRMKTRWGRRKPWVVASVPLLMLAVWRIFMPPEEVSIMYLGFWLFVLYLGFTMLTLSHMSWGTELSPNYHERSRVHGWREVAQISGMVMVLALPAIIQMNTEGDSMEPGIRAMGLFILILLPITVGIAAWKVPDNADAHAHMEIDWRQVMGIITGSPALRRVMLAEFLSAFAPSFTGALYIFFIRSVMELPQWSEVLLLFYFVAAIGGVPLWMRVSYKFGKHRAFSIGMLYGALTLCGFFILPKSVFWAMAVANVVYGIAFGAGPFLMRAMISDITDEDRVDSGQQKTGIYFALLMIVGKMAGAFALGLSGVMLKYVGFNNEYGAENSPEVIFAVAMMFVVVPVVAMVLAAATTWRFPLDEGRQRELQSKIDMQHVQTVFPDSEQAPTDAQKAPSPNQAD